MFSNFTSPGVINIILAYQFGLYSNGIVKKLIEEYVISEAKSMLLSTTMSIQQISDELNFPSQSVFGKYFKLVDGISPSEYRKGV